MKSKGSKSLPVMPNRYADDSFVSNSNSSTSVMDLPSESSASESILEGSSSRDNDSSSASCNDSSDSSHEEAGSRDVRHEQEEFNTEAEDDTLLPRNQKRRKRRFGRLQIFRMFVFAFLLAAGVSTSFIAYVVVSWEAQEAFETAYYDIAALLEANVLEYHARLLETSSSLASSVSLTAKSRNGTWPLFTMREFYVFANQMLETTNTDFMGIINVVPNDQYGTYVDYVQDAFPLWYKQEYWYQHGGSTANYSNPLGFTNLLWKIDGGVVPSAGKTLYFPLWTYSPSMASFTIVNFDFGSDEEYDGLLNELVDYNMTKAVPHSLSSVRDLTMFFPKNSSSMNEANDTPHSFLFTPVMRSIRTVVENGVQNEVVAFVAIAFAWDAPLRTSEESENGSKGLHVVLRNTCDQVFSYQIDDRNDITFLGTEDVHDTAFNDMQVTVDLNMNESGTAGPDGCLYFMDIYPSSQLYEEYTSYYAYMLAGVIAIAFALIFLLFVCSDWFFQQRIKKLSRKVTQSTKGAEINNTITDASLFSDPELDTTVLVADIVGFADWAQQLSQGLLFLETVYAEFNKIAKSRGVFQVDAIGHLYIASTGVPDSLEHHSPLMLQFAQDCMLAFAKQIAIFREQFGAELASKLELKMGIHSGAVTVSTRGDGSHRRVQLFGDTLSVAARLEFACEPGRILVSDETVRRLCVKRHGFVFQECSDKVNLKDDESLQLFWLAYDRDESRSQVPLDGSFEENKSLEIYEMSGLEEEEEHVTLGSNVLEEYLGEHLRLLVDWNVELLSNILCRVRTKPRATDLSASVAGYREMLETMVNPIEEVNLIFSFPDDTPVKEVSFLEDHLDATVARQLRDFVTCIATMHRPNPFHSFEYSTHMVMFVMKLVAKVSDPPRLSSPTNVVDWTTSLPEESQLFLKQLNKICWNPLTLLACAFACLVRNVDHPGIPNAQLTLQNASEAINRFRRPCAIQQNALEIAWSLFMDGRFEDLRSTMFASVHDLTYFREIVVNGVIATDMETRLKQNGTSTEVMRHDMTETVSRDVTVALENMIEASSIWYALQKWEVYLEWNKRQLREMLLVHENGLAETNPIEFWIQGEIDMFDSYVIPLAEKIQKDGFLGRFWEPYLHFAKKNREQWLHRGAGILVEICSSS